MSYKDLRESRLRLSGSLDGQRWIFLKKGLDDFRDGFPPSSHNVFVCGRKQPVSLTLQSSTLTSSPAALRRESKKSGSAQVCLCRLSALQRARRERVAQVERGLSQRPGALCPCLGRSCSSKGGGNCSVDEDTLKRLLSTSCEVEATVPLPFHAAKYNDVEAEKLRSWEASSPQSAVRSLPCQAKVPSQTKGVKIRYGAWYLDPKTWRKQKANEPLKAPEAAINSLGNAQKWSEKEMKIAQLRSTWAFKEFLERKGYRNPQFLPKMLAGEVDSRDPKETSKACKKVSKKMGQNKRRLLLDHDF